MECRPVTAWLDITITQTGFMMLRYASTSSPSSSFASYGFMQMAYMISYDISGAGAWTAALHK
ncbi:hypothetical protein [Paenibacillus taichungensis]|uniref:hypothetical protein n=1 Tax=Paenibacillus taichungensis TaxID=484184 RepID=UPI0039A0FC6B